MRVGFDKRDPNCEITVTIYQSAFGAISAGAVRARYFRLRMETISSVPVEGAIARLMSVTRMQDGKAFTLGPMALTIAPAERDDPTKKDVYPEVPEYIDVIAITEGNIISPVTPNFGIPTAINLKEVFGEFTDYSIKVVVSALSCPSVTATFHLKWTGDWSTSAAEPVLWPQSP